MSMKELPKMGDIVPVGKFHISKMNVRSEEPFGETEEDRLLIANLRQGKIIGPFKARPEDKEGHWEPGMDLSQAVGFGVVVGRRRFLAKKEVGVENFRVGSDCLIEEMSDEEAREASLVENLEVLRKEMDPITRAKRLSEIIAYSPTGLRGTAARLGLSPSTLSEWLKVLELGPKMQEAVSKGSLFFTDALQVARMKLGTELQEELAEVLETEGLEAFQKEVARHAEGKLKRGIPKGIYIVVRSIFDRRSRDDLRYYEALEKLAEEEGMGVADYVKKIVVDHIKSVAG